MKINSTIEVCPRCVRPFQCIHHFHGRNPRKREEITCPYCVHTELCLTDGYFEIRVLTRAEQSAYFKYGSV